MLWNEISQPLVIIVGPTAVGKTEMAIQLAERLDGEIVSADSRLFYRGMDIGTAKPTPEERARVPHHLIDVALPDEPWNLAIFQKEASRIIAEIHARNKLPFLVGGTGQYIQAVTQAWEIPAQLPDFRLRDVLDAWGKQIGALELHRKLSLIDPEAAARIEPRNLRRTVRALEVMLYTGQKFSAQRKKGVSPFRLCQIGLMRPREELYQRIDERIERMVADGLLGEVEKLLQQGYSSDLPAFSAIGYREMVQVARGVISVEEAVLLMKRYTRQFVRRQSNWFKENDPDIHWFELGRDHLNEIEDLLKQSGSYR